MRRWMLSKWKLFYMVRDAYRVKCGKKELLY